MPTEGLHDTWWMEVVCGSSAQTNPSELTPILWVAQDRQGQCRARSRPMFS